MDIGLRKKLHNWMHRQIYVESNDRGQCVKFVVKQIKANASIGMEVGTIPISEKVGSDDIAQYVTDLDIMATNDATGLGGMNRYVVLPYFKVVTDEENGKYELSEGSRYPFRIWGGDEDKEDGEEKVESTESPTTKGLMTQLMRHNETNFRMGAQTMMSTVQILQRENARLAEQNEQLIAKHVELIETIETLKTQRHERELMASTEQLKQDVIRDVANKGMTLAPILVNAMAKKRLMPTKTTPMEQMVHSFMASLKPAQFDELMKTFDDNQRLALMSIYESVRQFDPPEPRQVSDGQANGAAK